MLVLAVLALLALLAVRVDAAPAVVTAAPSAETADDASASGSPEGRDDASDVQGLDSGAAAELGEVSASGREPPDVLVDPRVAAALARAAPSLTRAIAAAYVVAGLAADPAPGFARRSRLAALVPWIGVRVGQDDTWHDVVDPTIGHVLVYDVRATWHFDRLVFDTNELRASAIEVARRRDRRRLALLVSRTYFTWLRARTAAARAPVWGLRADEAAAALTALTDGAWAPPSAPAPAGERR